MPPHPLTNLEVQKYYQNEPKFNGVYSRNNLPKIKHGAYVINLDKFKSIGIHSIDLHVKCNNAIFWLRWSWTYFKRNLKIHRKQKYETYL